MDVKKPFPSFKDLEKWMKFNVIKNFVNPAHKCVVCNGSNALVSVGEECCGNSSIANLSQLLEVDLTQFSITNAYYICLPCKFILAKILHLKVPLRQNLTVDCESHSEVHTFPGNEFHMMNFWKNSRPPYYMHFDNKHLKIPQLSFQLEEAAVALSHPRTPFDYYGQCNLYEILLKYLEDNGCFSEDDSKPSSFSDIKKEDKEEAVVAAAPLLEDLESCMQYEEDMCIDDEKFYKNEPEQAEAIQMDIVKYISPSNEDDSEVIRIPAAVIEYYSQMKQVSQNNDSEQDKRVQDPIKRLFMSDNAGAISAINIGEQRIQGNDFGQHGGMSGVGRNYVHFSNEVEREIAAEGTMETENCGLKNHTYSEASQGKDVLDEDEKYFSFLTLKKALEE